MESASRDSSDSAARLRVVDRGGDTERRDAMRRADGDKERCHRCRHGIAQHATATPAVTTHHHIASAATTTHKQW
jgi:hypothetical protein